MKITYTQTIFIVLISLITNVAIAQPTFNTIVIDATCPNNGSIEVVDVTGTSPFSYSIVSGPTCSGIVYPINQGTISLFQSLCPGTYSVVVSDNSNPPESTTQDVVVGGNYMEPDVVLSSIDPTCNGSNDGEVTATVTDGLAPFDYTVTGGTLSSPIICTDCSAMETFSGLGAGTYTVVTYDDCGSLQTRTRVISDPALKVLTAWTNNYNSPRRVNNCLDAVYVPRLYFGAFGTPDYTFEAFNSSGTSLGIINTSSTSAEFTLPIAGEPYSFTITDACGLTDDVSIAWSDKKSTFTNDFTCTTFDFGVEELGTFGESITIQAVGPGGTTTIGPSGNASIVFDNMPFGSYMLTVTNECGETENYTIAGTGPDAVTINEILTNPDRCIGDAKATVRMVDPDGKPWDWTLTSYPTEYTGVTSGTMTQASQLNLALYQLPLGDYTFYIEDDCGNFDEESFTISEVHTYDFSFEVLPACGFDDGTINWTGVTNAGGANIFIKLYDENGTEVESSGAEAGGSFINQPPGDYTLKVVSCNNDVEVHDVIIPEASQPDIDPLLGVLCNDGSLLITGAGINGRPNYTFQLFNKDLDPILSTPIQEIFNALEFEFANLASGTNYTVRIIDDCGNGDPVDVVVNGSLLLNIEEVCTLEGNVRLQTPFLSSVDYAWSKDGGAVISTENFIEFASPIPAADVGLYSVSITLGTCIDDVSTYNLEAPGICVLPMTLRFFQGKMINDGSVLLSWQTGMEINNAMFYVEKSMDGKIWMSMHQAKGAGDSNTANSYSVIDKSPFREITYYRLKQIDFDGDFTYSKIVSIMPPERGTLSVYPTFLKNTQYLNINNSTDFDYEIQFVNINGIKIGSIDIVEKMHSKKIGLDNLVPGIYFIQFKNSNSQVIQKIIVE